ncbi:MAG TPA: hypothetical protein PLW97_09355, partial [Synergistaceae bacterium]|nr:hypothetical protein [Synergistaceae bacterium]
REFLSSSKFFLFRKNKYSTAFWKGTTKGSTLLKDYGWAPVSLPKPRSPQLFLVAPPAFFALIKEKVGHPAFLRN